MKANNKSVHPTLARVRAEYPRCTAQTTAGLARYVHANKSTFPSHPIPFETPGLVQYFDGNWVGNDRTQTDKERFILRRHQIRYDQAEKTNEKLRKRLYGRFSVPAKSVGGVAKRAEEYNQILSMGKHPLPIVENAVLMGCHYRDQRFFEQQGIKICRRGYNWSISASLSPSRVAHTDGETLWKNGRAVKYTRAENDNQIRSFALIQNNGTKLAVMFHETEYALTAPAGYVWDKDLNGIKLVDVNNRADDYHPSAQECFEAQRDESAGIVAAIQRNKNIRQQEIAKLRAEKADAEGVFVCLADSLRGGNCLTGSLGFASRAELSTKRHISAEALMEAAVKVGENMGRVRLAISQAIHRHRREMAQGFALLSEHKV